MKKFLTIFTPTYNRRHTLKRLYDSLDNQTCYQFEWLIVDDGSTDETKELIEELIRLNSNKFKIRYYYQENSGKHVANNLGLKKAKGNLFTCLDSDDWLYSNAVEFIIEKFNTNYEVNGFIALDTFDDGRIVGEELPRKKEINWINLRYVEKVKGDKCYVFKTNVIKQFPFPQYGNSRHMPPSYQLVDYSKHYSFYLFNTPIKYVEYQEDGITSNVRKNYFESAENYCLYRINIHEYLPNNLEKIKNIILYNFSWIELKLDKNYSFKGKEHLLSILLLPLSLPLYTVLKRRIQK